MPPGFFARSFDRKPSPAAEREQEAQDDTKHAADQQRQRAGALVSSRKDVKLEWEETWEETPVAVDTPPPAAAAVLAPLAAEQRQVQTQLAAPVAARSQVHNKKKSAFKQLFAKWKQQLGHNGHHHDHAAAAAPAAAHSNQQQQHHLLQLPPHHAPALVQGILVSRPAQQQQGRSNAKHVHLVPKLQAERTRIAAESAALRQRLQLLAVAINRLAAARQYLGTAAGAAMEAGDSHAFEAWGKGGGVLLATARQYLGTAAGAAMEAGDR
ncbi:hypothetical protein OEZ86_001234 [Tetradesmus obliquus]|nr:hypothetical protein OEZ86_001234 [Tetradesmus obliquus]